MCGFNMLKVYSRDDHNDTFKHGRPRGGHGKRFNAKLDSQNNKERLSKLDSSCDKKLPLSVLHLLPKVLSVRRVGLSYPNEGA